MLTADQIEALGDKARQIIEPITEYLIADIARRISEAGQLTSTASYQVWRLQQLGISQRRLKKELRKRLKVSHRELRKLLTQAAEVGYNFDISKLPYVQAVPFEKNQVIQRIVSACVKMAQDDLSNMTQTLGFATRKGHVEPLTVAYQQACDLAFQKVALGAQDYNSAVREATKALADRGIVTIDYESGVHTSLEAAVRRNVMGALGLMQEQISQQNHDDLGADGWEISAHAASAPDHEPIQGRQYSDEAYKRLNDSLVRRIGTLNCGHSAFPIIMGVNSPQYTKEELEQFRRDNEKGFEYEGRHYTMYEATQHQRQLERMMRKQKRRILIDEKLGDKEQLAADQTRLVRLKDEYARFTKASGLRSQIERGNIDGFGPKQARAAEKGAKAASQKQESAVKTKKTTEQAYKTLEKSSDRGTMKPELTETDTKAIHDYMSAKSYAVNEKLRTGVPLTEEEQTFVNNLDAALKKMPTYQGTLRRSLIFESDDDVQAFMQTYIKGAEVRYSQYVSTTRGPVYNPGGQVQIVIKNAKKGRDISALNSDEAEVLYERGTSFTTTEVIEKDGKYFIFMEENDE